MDSRGKLQELLAELEHSSSLVQRSSTDSRDGEDSLPARMRQVLHLLFQDYGNVGKLGKEAPTSILKIMLSLLCLALDKFPEILSENGCSTIPVYFAKVFQLLSAPKLRPLHAKIMDTLDRLTSQCLLDNTTASVTIYRDTATLVQDLSSVFAAELEAQAPQGMHVALDCFLGAFSSMAQQSNQSEERDAGPSPHDGLPRCLTLTLGEEAAVLDVAAASAHVLCRLMRGAPLVMRNVSAAQPNMPSFRLLCLRSNTDQQAEFLQAIHAEASELCPGAFSPCVLFCAVREIIESVTRNFSSSDTASRAWWSAAIRCLELCLSKLSEFEPAGLHALAAEFVSVVSVLTQGASNQTSDYYTSLLSILASAVDFQPHLLPTALRTVDDLISAAIASDADIGYFTDAVGSILRHIPDTRDQNLSRQDADSGRNTGDKVVAMLLALRPSTNWTTDAQPLQRISGTKMLIAALVSNTHVDGNCGLAVQSTAHWVQWFKSTPNLPIENTCAIMQLLETLGTFLFYRLLSGGSIQNASAIPTSLQVISCLDSPWIVPTGNQAKLDQSGTEGPSTVHSKISAMCCCFLFWAVFWKSKSSAAAEEFGSRCQQMLEKCLKDASYEVRAFGVAALPLIAVVVSTQSSAAQGSAISPLAEWGLMLLAEKVEDQHLKVRSRLGGALKSLQIVASSLVADQSREHWILHAVSIYYDICQQSTTHPMPRHTAELLVQSVRQFFQQEDHSEQQCNANGPAGFPSHDIQPFLAMIADNEQHPEVQCSLLDFLRTWLMCDHIDASIRNVAGLVKQCIERMTCSDKPVRSAAAALLPAILKPRVLVHIYNANPSADGLTSVKEAEVLLLKDLRGKLEAFNGAEFPEVWHTVMASIAEVASQASTREGLWMSLVMLVDPLDNENPAIRVAAADLLHAVARKRGVKLTELISQPRVMEYVGRRLGSKPRLLPELADMLGLQVSAIAQRLVPAVLPRLVISQDMHLLEVLAQCLHLSLRDMLVNYGHHTVAYILLEGRQDIEEYAAFMFKYTEVEFDDLLRSSLRSILKEVIWSAGDHKRWTLSDNESTTAGLQPSAELIENVQKNVLGCILRIHLGRDINEEETNSAVADFLHEEQMIWLLSELVGDRVKRGKETEPAEQLQALRCLSLLIIFVGDHMADFVPLMMTLLTRAMELPSLEVQLQGLAVWELFIRQLSRQAVEMLHIHAVRIAVILTAFLESGGRASTAACIAMEELVLRNQGLPREILCEFPPLPNLPALGAVNQAIAEARGDLSAPHHLMTLAEALVPNRPGHYAGQPLIVKAVTMMEIKRFLQQHQEWRLSLAVRQKRIPGADTWHSALDFLVAVLLKSCDPEVRSALSHRVHLQCAECLGCVGAVDPGKLTQVNDYKDALSKAQNVDKICNSEEELAKEVLKALVHLLSGSSDLEILEAATFGIQELLSAFRGAQRDVDSGWDLFRNVDEEFQAVVRPYLNTKYQLQQSLSSGAIVSPIFGSPGLSFRRWLCLWLQQLTDALPQERATIFRACTGVSRHDIPIMMLLLPHAVLSVLALGSDMARSSVLQEIHSVLQGSIQTDRVQADWQLLAQAVFILLDKLVDWVARSENSGPGRTSSRGPEESASYLSCGRDLVEGTLKEVDRRTLARAAFRCGAFARAMQYFEAAVREEQGGGLNPAARMNATYAESDVSFFISIYSELEEPDGISGFTRLRQGGPTNSDMVLAAERRGSWAEALTLYEQALQQEARRSAHAGSVVFDSLSSHASGQLDCLLHMGHLQAVLQQTEGLALHAVGEARCKLAVKGIAAAWRMGRWNELENCLQVAHENPHLAGTDEIWEVRIGEILISMRDRANAKLLSQLEAARHELMGPLSAAAMESHLRAYPYVVRLHMLQEIEDAIQCIPALQPDGAADGSVDIRPDVIARKLHWKERLACMQISLSAQEPVLSLRRQIAAVGGIPCEEGRCFLLQAKLSRKTGHFDSAAISCFEAMSLKAEGSSLEYAKLLWSTGESHRAINILQDAVSCSTESADDTGRCAIKTKVLLQLARWMSVTGQGGHDQVTEHFLKALRSDERCEKTYFYFGKYLDQLMQDAKRRQDSAGRTSKAMKDRLGGKSKVALGQDQHHFDLLPKVLHNYASAAKHGHRLIMQSLPRLLTLWYDFGSGLSEWLTSAEGSEESILEKAVEAVADVMDAAATDIPVYSWLMVLSQLISRMCHRDGDVAAVTRQIITRATEAYPQQSFWSLVPVVRSKYKQRSKAATEIMTRAKKNILASRDAKQKGSKCQDLFSQFPALVDQLIALANYVPDQRVRRFDLTREGGLTHVTRMNPDEVILPVLDMLTPELPADGVSSLSHNAFSGRTTTIQGIKKEVEVMASLQKPKKVVFLGSDGHPYTFLAKPKDDLRKDQRLMELATALNRLFVKHPASRQRNLYLRTFNVVPLTEDCGIIQWVNFTIGFRHCCQAAYAVPGKSPKAALQAVKALYERFEKAPGKKWKAWYNEVVDMFPPMMHKWFLKQFSTPANWFDARLRFSRTTAVWSMVGHVLGLGDRHGENLLIDRMSGDCVHVDFSCLFDKGLTLEKPEMVPFRLTQNIIDSFGPSGIEGIFRSVCGITLQVLRANQETILSILETFVHDPLVEWDRQAMRSGPSARATGDSENLQARDALRITDGRLNGTLIGVSSKPSLPLSPEGHAHRLIEEAIDRENLGRMYIWWMVWF